MLQENGSQSWLGMMLLQLIRVPPTGLIRLRLRISAIVTASINYLMGQWVSLSLSLPETNLGDELVQFDEFLGSTAGLPRCNMLLQLLAIWRCSMTCGICKGNDVMQHTTISYIINHYHTLNVTQRMVSDFSHLTYLLYISDFSRQRSASEVCGLHLHLGHGQEPSAAGGCGGEVSGYDVSCEEFDTNIWGFHDFHGVS